MDAGFDGHVGAVGAEPPAPARGAAQQDRATVPRQRGLDPRLQMEADGVGGRDLADHLLAARRREQLLLSAQFVHPLVQIEAALVVQAEGLVPAVMLHVQPDGAVAVALIGGDMDRRPDQARAQQFALPAAQRFVQRPLAQGQGRMAGRQPQGLTIRRPRGPAGAGHQPILAAGDLQRHRLGAGGRPPGATGRRGGVGDDGQQGAGDPRQAGDGSGRRMSGIALGRGGLVMGAGGGDTGDGGRSPALETGQATVGQGQKPQALRQAGDGARYGVRRRLGQLGQGVVQGQQVEQQLQPGLGTA